MVAEVFAGLSAIKTAFDITKGLKDINDSAIRNAAIIELQEKLLSARDDQTALLERVSNLEKEVANFETWDTEKEKYELKEVHPGTFARAVKLTVHGAEPTHLICTNCYENRRKSVLQKLDSTYLFCPHCKTKFLTGSTSGSVKIMRG